MRNEPLDDRKLDQLLNDLPKLNEAQVAKIEEYREFYVDLGVCHESNRQSIIRERRAELAFKLFMLTFLVVTQTWIISHLIP